MALLSLATRAICRGGRIRPSAGLKGRRRRSAEGTVASAKITPGRGESEAAPPYYQRTHHMKLT